MKFGMNYSEDDSYERVIYVDRPRKGNKNPNPDPYNFEIKDKVRKGSFIALKVHYPDATTYEGNKIPVVENMNNRQLRECVKLDPHFFPEGPVIARFKPSRQGWKNALAFIRFKAEQQKQTENQKNTNQNEP